MFETIIKRNGTVVPFDPQKIANAILKAGQATGGFDEGTARRLCRIVVAKAVKSLDQASVEAIQDIVEVTLMENGYYRTAKAYILYREQHAKIRKVNELLGLNLVNDYLGKSDWRVKENSNMDYSLQGLNNYLAGHIVSTYWLNQIYPPEVREAHTSGDIHIHDLNSLSPYCVWLGPRRSPGKGVPWSFPESGVRTGKTFPVCPGTNLQFPVYTPRGGGGRNGPLALRHPPRSVREV